MPLQVRAFPKYLPQILSSYVGRLGERVLTNDRRIVPLRANLEYFDALPIQAVANIEFWTYVRRRSALGQESRHGIFDALNVKIVECHGLYLVKQGELRHCTQQQLSGIVLVRELPAKSRHSLCQPSGHWEGRFTLKPAARSNHRDQPLRTLGGKNLLEEPGAFNSEPLTQSFRSPPAPFV